MSSLETSDSPAAIPTQIEVPAAPSVELAQPEPTPPSIDAPDSMPLPDSALETEQSTEPENTLPETPEPDSTLEVEQPTDPDLPSTPTPDVALPTESETETATTTDQALAPALEQTENTGTTTPTLDLDVAAAETSVQDPEAPAAQVVDDQSGIAPEDLVDEPPAAGETSGSSEAPSDETTRSEPETPERRESPLGKASEHPDRSLSPADHEARKQAGLARSRELIGKENWANSKYAGEVYYDKLPQDLKDKYPDGVEFSYEGFPIFDKYATQTAVLPDGFGESRDDDFKNANQIAGLAETPSTHTWHHKEDGKTLVLVDRELHAQVRHWGGVAITKILG